MAGPKKMKLQEAIEKYREKTICWSWMPEKVIYEGLANAQWVVFADGQFKVFSKKEKCELTSVLQIAHESEEKIKELFPLLFKEEGFLTIVSEGS